MTIQQKLEGKPIPLRAVFISNLVVMILSFVAVGATIVRGTGPFDIPAVAIQLTSLTYVVTFATMVWSILNRKIWLFRAVFVINIVASLPARAYLGIAVGLFSLAMSFLQPKILAYFDQPKS